MIAIFPEIATASVARQYDHLGMLIRQYFAGEQQGSPKLSAFDLAESAGLTVARAGALRTGVGAIVARDVAGRVDVSIILLNEGISPVEENFLIAHMFGHWLMHIQPTIARGEWRTKGGFSEEALPSTYFDGYVIGSDKLSAPDLMESEANHFALSLLLPKPMIEKAFTRLQDLGRLATLFAVPELVVRCRLVQLGLIAAPAADFTAAERRLRRTNAPVNEALGGRELINALADKMNSDQPKSHMPRSFAASSYGTMQRQTDQDMTPAAPQKPKTQAPIQSQVKVDEKSDKNTAPKSKPGLDRIRELARKMDPSVK